MDSNDRRVKRTEKILTEALVTASLEKGYDLVTIKDITDRADVSYSTFFRHYRDKDELLLKVLESVIETLYSLIQHLPNHSAEVEGCLIFEHIYENHLFYRVLFGGQTSNRVLGEMQDVIVQDMLSSHPIDRDSPIPQEIAANHMVVSIMGLIKWWLDHDMPYPTERMGSIYAELIVKAVAPTLRR